MIHFNMDLLDSLRRINFEFEEREIMLRSKIDSDKITIFNKDFGPFQKGKTYKMKYFLASALITHNIMEIHPNDKCDDRDIQRFAVSERDDHKLKEYENNYFLNKIRNFKPFLEKDVNDKIKPKTNLDRYNSYAANIIDSRLLKLLRLARSNLSVADERKLTKSEKMLFEKLNNLILIWRDFFIAL